MLPLGACQPWPPRRGTLLPPLHRVPVSSPKAKQLCPALLMGVYGEPGSAPGPGCQEWLGELGAASLCGEEEAEWDG